jgi:hypothetical protein
VRLSRSAGASILPAVAVDPDGDPSIAWTDLRHGGAEIYFRASPDLSGVPAGSEPAGVARVALGRPSPVPSGGEVTIAFTVREASTLAVCVFDVAGRCVATLARGDFVPGTYGLSWDGTSDGGGRSAAGVYFVRCEVRGSSEAQVRAVVLVR